MSIYFNLVAFCPAVNFLRGISSGGRLVRAILCCGILSRGILSVHPQLGYYGEPIGSHTRATQALKGPSDPIYDQSTPSPKLGVGNPQSKLASQIAAKRYQIQGWELY